MRLCSSYIEADAFLRPVILFESWIQKQVLGSLSSLIEFVVLRVVFCDFSCYSSFRLEIWSRQVVTILLLRVATVSLSRSLLCSASQSDYSCPDRDSDKTLPGANRGNIYHDPHTVPNPQLRHKTLHSEPC